MANLYHHTMKKIATLFCFLITLTALQAQVFDVVQIQNSGDPNKCLNLVIMGDGYTADQQEDFIDTASDITSYLFSIAPWTQYKNYFNVYAIKVISPESGVKHANTASDCASYFTEVSAPNNYFATRFDGFGIHRLTIAPLTGRIGNVLATNFPNYDLVFIVGNTPQYGGSGGTYAVFTANAASSEIAAHEIGHTFAGLADEYYAGDQYFAEKINMTQESDPTLIKWKNWVGTGTTGIHNYCCGGNSNLWYKPTNNTCKMEQLNLPYCNVCKEGIIEKIHALVNPIVSYSPENSSTVNTASEPINFQLTELLRPIPNTLHIQWQLDSSVFDTNLDSYQINPATLSDGLHSLTATVTDPTTMVRVDNHATIHVSTVNWTINKSSLGIETHAVNTKIAYTLFPNPVQSQLHLAFDLDQAADLSVAIINLDGKTISEINKKTNSGKFEENLTVENLSAGTYIALVKINGVAFPQTFVKN